MKLLRVGEFNQEIVATLDEENKLRDLSSYIKDLNPSTFNEENLQKLTLRVNKFILSIY